VRPVGHPHVVRVRGEASADRATEPKPMRILLRGVDRGELRLLPRPAVSATPRSAHPRGVGAPLAVTIASLDATVRFGEPVGI